MKKHLSSFVARIGLPLLFWGCASHQNLDSAQSPEAVAPATAEKTVHLSSLSDRILFKEAKHRPLIGEHYIVDFQHSDLTIYEASSLKIIKIFHDTACEQAPAFLGDNKLLIAHNHQLALIDLETMDRTPLASLESPLLAAPCIINDKLIFVQYVNNIAQCFDLKGQPVWKAMLPYSASYFKKTSYAPCADEKSIYLAYPGGSLIKISQINGVIEWISPVITDQKHAANSKFSLVQLQSPLQQTDDLILAQTSNNTCLCIDKDTGALKKSIDLAQQSQSYLNDSYLYTINSDSFMNCYDLDTLQLAWSLPIEGNQHIVGEISTHPSLIFLNSSEGDMIALNSETGEKISTLSHSLKEFDLFVTHDEIYGFNAQGSLTRLQVPQTIES